MSEPTPSIQEQLEAAEKRLEDAEERMNRSWDEDPEDIGDMLAYKDIQDAKKEIARLTKLP